MYINNAPIISTIEAELNNIVGTTNRTIQIMESDPVISACIHGRNLEQITGKKGMTKARYPNLLNKVKGMISMNVLRKAQDNYNAKLEKMITDATKEASLEIAQYMCNKIAQNGGETNTINGTHPETKLTQAYGIVYEIGNGMRLEDIAGRGESNSSLNGNINRNVTSTFDRESRTCQICTTMTNEHCEMKLKKKGNWFISDRYEQVCNSGEPKTTCKSIVM